MAFSFFRWEALERLKDNLDLTESQWDGVRAVTIVGTMAIVGAAGYWGGRPLWAHWQSRQSLAQSRAFAEKKDYANMALALRRATQQAPQDPFVWEETARELALIGSPDELFAQEELTRLEPNDQALRLAFVQEALRFGRYDTARSALDEVDAAHKQQLAYQRLAVALALAERQPDQLRIELARLIKLDPGNNNARFTYAAIRLWDSDPATIAAARRELESLLGDPAVRVRAAIELVTEAARRRDPRRVHEIIGRCLAVFVPGSRASASGSDVKAWEALLGGLKAAAPAVPTDAALMARWLADLRRRPEALAWLKSLPAAVRSSAPVLDLTAQLAAEELDYSALAAALRAGAWGAWPAPAWEQAIAHQRERTATPPVDRAGAWEAAVAACGNSLDGIRNLGRLASAWQRPLEAEQAWLTILDRAPSVVWAYDTLRSSYLGRHDLDDLLALYARWVEQFPLDDTAAERWLSLAALLDRTSAAIDSRAESLNATDSAAIAAKAAVAWRRGRPSDAETLLLTLSPADQKKMDVSFWIALVESNLGHYEAARDALKTAMSYPRGPEETALLNAAAKRARPRPPV